MRISDDGRRWPENKSSAGDAGMRPSYPRPPETWFYGEYIDRFWDAVEAMCEPPPPAAQRDIDIDRARRSHAVAIGCGMYDQVGNREQWERLRNGDS